MLSLRVGIICQTMVQQHQYRNIIEGIGCTAPLSYLIHQILDGSKSLSKGVGSVDLWLVDVDFDKLNKHEETFGFENWLFELELPVIFGEGESFTEIDENFTAWSRKITEKLVQVAAEISRGQRQETSANFVWVLGASTGGPEAVKRFLDRIPSGVGLAFVYAQHIQTGAQKRLAETITRDSQYHCRMAEHGQTLAADTVTLVPAEQQMDILLDGTVFLRKENWRGDYRPSIDQVVAIVANRYRQRSGVIFFSGMGDDGMAGAKIMANRRGRVWIQSPSSCTIESMPANINKTGCVTATGSPEQLAGLLMNEIRIRNNSSVAVNTTP